MTSDIPWGKVITLKCLTLTGGWEEVDNGGASESPHQQWTPDKVDTLRTAPGQQASTAGGPIPGYHIDAAGKLTLPGAAALGGRGPAPASPFNPASAPGHGMLHGQAQQGTRGASDPREVPQQQSPQFPDFRRLPLLEQVKLKSVLQVAAQMGAVDFSQLPDCPAWLLSHSLQHKMSFLEGQHSRSLGRGDSGSLSSSHFQQQLSSGTQGSQSLGGLNSNGLLASYGAPSGHEQPDFDALQRKLSQHQSLPQHLLSQPPALRPTPQQAAAAGRLLHDQPGIDDAALQAILDAHARTLPQAANSFARPVGLCSPADAAQLQAMLGSSPGALPCQPGFQNSLQGLGSQGSAGLQHISNAEVLQLVQQGSTGLHSYGPPSLG